MFTFSERVTRVSVLVSIDSSCDIATRRTCYHETVSRSIHYITSYKCFRFIIAGFNCERPLRPFKDRLLSLHNYDVNFEVAKLAGQVSAFKCCAFNYHGKQRRLIYIYRRTLPPVEDRLFANPIAEKARKRIRWTLNNWERSGDLRFVRIAFICFLNLLSEVKLSPRLVQPFNELIRIV